MDGCINQWEGIGMGGQSHEWVSKWISEWILEKMHRWREGGVTK